MRLVSAHRISALVLIALSIVTFATPARADDAADVKAAIATQFDLLKAGDVDKLKAHFTERQKEKITKEAVEKGKGNAAKMTIDDLVASVDVAGEGAKKTAKIKMKNGRTLTTLILTDGKWLADTIWFK
ncbi:hypothetical protein [Humisphaera borealis]|uniref:DUF4878 domain-containing protein n=1 Tax=Humisphaera borealis TaxID=2807512 RepID=A0A7M2WTM3_9BACT|nr:hypothetical protein [Humisphaera borealis]QOV88171.1 hypothetical protein IPV69_18165 [Humisphaera borealis]